METPGLRHEIVTKERAKSADVPQGIVESLEQFFKAKAVDIFVK